MALITEIDELKKYIEANQSVDIDTLLPSVNIAERRYIKSLLGNEQYQQLITAYKTPDTANLPEGITDELLPLVQEAIANIAMVLAMPRIAVTVSDAGIKRPETDGAFQYQEINLQQSYANAGFDALELILEYLDGNKGEYPLWANSSAYTEQKKFIISTATQFSSYFEIYRSRQTYIAVRYTMHRIEMFTLKAILGNALFNAIKQGITAGAINDAYQNLIDNYIGPGIALSAIATGLIERAVEISDMGVTVSTIAPDRNRPSKEPAPSDKVQKNGRSAKR